MNVSDIMTREVITAKENDPIVDVAHLISKNRIHSVPIVDDRGFLLGVVAESDFFTKSDSEDIYIPSYIELLQKLRFLETAEPEEKEKVRTLLLAKAGDVMTKDVVTIEEGKDVHELLDIVRTTGFSSIPVVGVDMRLLGIVTVIDALEALVPEKDAPEAVRNIDREAKISYSWLGDRFHLVKSYRVNTGVAILIVAFFAGALASVIFNRALAWIYGS